MRTSDFSMQDATKALEAIPDALWPRILAAAEGDEAARLLLLGFGSSCTRFRGLSKKLLSFRMSACCADVSALRASFLKIDSLCVALGRADVLALGALDGIRRLHIVGGSRSWERPKQQMLSVKSLTLAGWRGNLEFLDAMPLLDELSIDKLDSGPTLWPIAGLLQLRVVTAEWRVARDIRYEGVVLPPDCTLWCGGSICPTG